MRNSDPVDICTVTEKDSVVLYKQPGSLSSPVGLLVALVKNVKITKLLIPALLPSTAYSQSSFEPCVSVQRLQTMQFNVRLTVWLDGKNSETNQKHTIILFVFVFLMNLQL